MIRKITVDDFDEWKILRLEAVKLNPESFGESYEGVEKQGIRWFEESLKNSITFSYLQDGKMVGLVGVFSAQPENMRHRANLFGLYVKAEHRGKGIGSTLVEQVIGYAKPNHKQIHLTVTTTNQSAMSLYKKHGFVIYGTEPDALLVDGKYYDEYLMMKKL